MKDLRATPLWTPPKDARENTRLGRFLDRLEANVGSTLTDHETAWRWSVENLERFWSELVDELGIEFHDEPQTVLASPKMPGARWFPGATLNYAEQLLAMPGVADNQPMVWSLSQSRDPVVLTATELRREVAACRAGLQALGVGSGDRVAAYLPNIAEAMVAMLATASLGAIWSSCAPEFGTRAVLDRLTQIKPKVLFVVDGYRYGERDVDRAPAVAEIRAGLPSVAQTVFVPYGDHSAPDRVPGAITWSALTAEVREAELTFEHVPFDQPLYVLYSSGTTGLPKPIVHGHGGITLEHAKQLAFYADLAPGDRFFWFSTTGWMMWNLLASGPMVGSAIVLFDGDPGHPGLDRLWRMAEDIGVTFFGTSAPFLMACRKAGIRPGEIADLSALRAIGSTGAPLPPEGFDWVYDAVKGDLLLSSVSGGTDVCTAFVGGSPLTPVRSGEISCRYLGCKVEAFDPEGRPLTGEQGELVLTEPMPSMPVGFWGDDDGSAYRAAYFDDFPGVWRHGDWITIRSDGTCVISGRSDATLNRGGVRLGTSDFYAAVEDLPEITDSLVVHLESESEDALGELLLFVVLSPGSQLDDGLRGRIAAALRTQLSPRHVPDRIEAVPAVPRTLSGKKLEVPVKRILSGTKVDQAVSRGALADPAALAPFEAIAASRRHDG